MLRLPENKRYRQTPTNRLKVHIRKLLQYAVIRRRFGSQLKRKQFPPRQLPFYFFLPKGTIKLLQV